MSEALTRDFRVGKLHSAYQRLNLRMDWETIKPLSSGSVKRPDGSTATDAAECARLRRNYFHSLLNCDRAIDQRVWDSLPAPACLPPAIADAASTAAVAAGEPNDDLSLPPAMGEIQAAVDKLKNHKAAGVCRILPEMMKYGGEAVTKWLHHIIAQVWITGVAPADWKKALIVPVLKKGNPAELDNYRGISLLSIPGKVYALILRSRLENWAEGIMSETQSGFRPGRGCNDAIFCLKMLYERALLKQKPVFTCFIDLSKAYDSANRQLAWKILRSRGAPGKIVDLIQDLHRGTTCAMQSDCSRPENWFEVATGFKQGDVNAPLLFNVYNFQPGG